jgi:hypothetical protein
LTRTATRSASVQRRLHSFWPTQQLSRRRKERKRKRRRGTERATRTTAPTSRRRRTRRRTTRGGYRPATLLSRRTQHTHGGQLLLLSAAHRQAPAASPRARLASAFRASSPASSTGARAAAPRSKPLLPGHLVPPLLAGTLTEAAVRPRRRRRSGTKKERRRARGRKARRARGRGRKAGRLASRTKMRGTRQRLERTARMLTRRPTPTLPMSLPRQSAALCGSRTTCRPTRRPHLRHPALAGWSSQAA